MRQLVPRIILENYSAGNYHGKFPAVGLFVDISGFSVITDTLMLHGQHGAEVLARIMRQVFGPLSQSIFEQGGFIVGYAGDALTAFFPLNNDPARAARRALAAAWAIHQQMSAEPEHTTEYGIFPISAKVGLARGDAHWGILRSKDRRRATYYFQGSAVNGPAEAEHHAHAGEIILAKNFYRLVRIAVKANPLGDFYRLTGVEGELPAPQPVDPPALFADAMRVFFPEALLYQDMRSEFRQAINLFISLPEMPGDMQREFMETLFDLQSRYGGLFTRVDYGDKGCNVLLFWGAPVAFENDIERALNFVLELRAHSEVQFTAGVTYYISRAGFMGSDLMEEYTCYGWGINLAARLMLSAPRGEIWLDERVARRAEHRFDVNYVGEQNFKGFSQKQKVFVLHKRKEMSESFFQGVMVGREKEIQTLTEFVAPLWDGKYAGPLTVWGDPGMGKSRLVYEFQTSSLFASHQALWALCQSDQILRESFNPFSYWLQRYFNVSDAQEESRNKSNFDLKLAGLIDSAPDKSLTEEINRTRSFLAALLDLYWPDSLYEQMDARGRYDNTFIALTSLIKAESLRQPLILSIEDAQYLDDDSEAFIISLMRSLKADPREYPLAIISTSRREGVALPLEQALLGQEINLGGLSPAALARQAETILGSPASPELIQLLEERAEGNPFFAEQILHYLQEEALLEMGKNGWNVVKNRQEVALPADIKAVLIARLDQLTREVKNVVQTASVLGREFEIQVLAYMLGNEKSLRDEIVEAEKAAIWSALNEIRYIFKHALLRDAAYTMQMQARREELHALAVSSLESVFAGRLDSHFGELAYHSEQANLTNKARAYLQKAGIAAQEAYQNNPAIDYFTRALALTPENDLEIRYELLLSRQKVYHLQAKSQEEEQDINALQVLAKQLQDKSRQLQVAIQYADYFIRTGNYPPAIEKALAAMALAEETGREDWKVDAMVSIVNADWQKGDYAAVLRHAEDAIALARKTGAREMEGRLLNALGLAILEQKNPAAARTYFEQSLAIFREIGNQRAETQSLSNLGMVAGYDTDFAAAQNYYERALALNRQIGSRNSESNVLNNLGWIAGLLGNFKMARSYVEQTIRIAREIDNRPGEIYGMINLSAYAGVLGDYATALDAAQQSLLLAQKTHNRNAEAWALTYQGHILLALDRNPEAKDAYQAALKIRQETEQLTLAAEPFAGLARIALGQNDLASAHAWVEPILAHLDAGNSLDGTDEPLRVYLTCYLVLRALNHERAASILETAHKLLLERAGNIDNEALHRSFLENIPYHREILAAWEAEQAKG